MKKLVLWTLWIVFWPVIETLNLIDDWLNGGIGAEEYPAKTALYWFYQIVFWPLFKVLDWVFFGHIPTYRCREINGEEHWGGR